ncbi:MAG: hypothetical protein OXC81_01825 [Betaproteobacteria bacterium]|nr:hypothetical protein [Betaproteobacteria bacterium]
MPANQENALGGKDFKLVLAVARTKKRPFFNADLNLQPNKVAEALTC